MPCGAGGARRREAREPGGGERARLVGARAPTAQTMIQKLRHAHVTYSTKFQQSRRRCERRQKRATPDEVRLREGTGGGQWRASGAGQQQYSGWVRGIARLA